MDPTITEEDRRTAPLALWRYAHEYLRSARHLCTEISVLCTESQVPYHIAAQGIEFALKSFLRARGATMAELDVAVGHSLAVALERSVALGMPALPQPWRAAVAEVARCHRRDAFVYMEVPSRIFPDIGPLVDAGVWILDRVAPDVVEHFEHHLAGGASPGASQFLQRMRADLSATSPLVRPQPLREGSSAPAAGDD